MAEYFEREALRKEVERIYQKHFAKSREKFIQDTFKAMFKRIDNAPAADVVPVVHGRWEHLEDGWFDLWKCSACGDEWTFEYDPTDSETKVNYCPNCGARMDGDGNG